MSLFAELKRRNVFRVGIAYAVVAWVLLQAVDIVVPILGLPEWTAKFILLLLVVGLPLALFFAWAYEITPEGLKLEKDVDRSQSITHKTSRKLDYTIIAVLAVAVVFLVVDKFALEQPADETAAQTEEDTERQSIAVLPFANRSADPDSVFFADGIHDDLLTSLAQIGSLKVISRTSVMEYRDTTKNMKQIGDELGVATILEGAVQKAGNNVRINVQLIDTNTDEHLWADTYDRALTTENIFAIQSEIAAAITAALKATFTPEEQHRIAAVPTENLEAYNLYLAGRQNLHQRTLESTTAAREQFEHAINQDPDFAEAYSGLADSVNLLYFNHGAISADETFEVAGDAISKALALNDQNAEIHASEGLLKMNEYAATNDPRVLKESQDALQRAIALNPNDAQAQFWFGNTMAFEGRYEEAIRWFKKSLVLDPLARVPQMQLAIQYATLGRNQDALDRWLGTVDLHPDWAPVNGAIAGHLGALGRFDEALAWALIGFRGGGDLTAGVPLVNAYADLGDLDSAARVFENVPEEHPFYALTRAGIYELKSEHRSAYETVVAAYGRSERPPRFSLGTFTRTAVKVGEYQNAKEMLERTWPTLTDPQNPDVDANNVGVAIRLAYALQKLGQTERAEVLLTKAMQVVEQSARVGFGGHGILDVEIHALSDQPEEALAAMRLAFDAGWRNSYSVDAWPLDQNPYLDTIRDAPGYQEIAAAIEGHRARMRESAEAAQASGNWEPLLEKARTVPIPDSLPGVAAN